MSVTPITSKTARIGPPAMIPSPCLAGAISTRDAPCSPTTLCWIVPLRSWTLTMLRRADSIALVTATGTSFALPLPMPIRPSPSPTTVSAAKLSVRPPLTTFVTRLTAIIFSFRPSSLPSVCWRGVNFAMCVFLVGPSELQAGFARRLGQRLHAAVVREARTVERDLLDAGRLRALGDALADDRRRRDVAALARDAQLLAHFLLGRRRAREHLAAVVRDDAGVDVQVGAVHGQAGDPLLRDARARLARTAQALVFLREHRVAPYFFFVSLSTTRSFA